MTESEDITYSVYDKYEKICYVSGLTYREATEWIKTKFNPDMYEIAEDDGVFN